MTLGGVLFRMSQVPLHGGAGPASREPDGLVTCCLSLGGEGRVACWDGSRIRVKGSTFEVKCFGFRV